jgi:peroxiredoxin Q/BCP
MLSIGSAAPDFSATDHEGVSVSLSSVRGKWLALWWYPKASTPG